MRISKLTSIILLSALLLVASACSSAPGQTPPATRAATQTPWIIDRVVTATPEPPIVTVLPTIALTTPTRTATKAVAKPTSTKAPPTVAVAAAPTATAAPACSLGTVTPTFPEDGAPRNTRPDGSGGSAVIFKWQPPASLSGQTDPHVGYMVQVESRRGNQHINGTTLFVSANKFLQDGQLILDPRAVSSLAAGDDAVAIWNVTVVKTSGGFNDGDPTVRPPDLINCGSPSQNSSIRLLMSS